MVCFTQRERKEIILKHHFYDMEENEKARNTIHFFFRGMGIAAVVISFRISLITGISVSAIKTLWYTFLYVFMEAIWFGLAVMFIIDLYNYIKKRFL